MTMTAATYGRNRKKRPGLSAWHIAALDGSFSDSDREESDRVVEESAKVMPSKRTASVAKRLKRDRHAEGSDESRQNSSSEDPDLDRSFRPAKAGRRARRKGNQSTRPSTPPNFAPRTPHLSASSSLSPEGSILASSSNHVNASDMHIAVTPRRSSPATPSPQTARAKAASRITSASPKSPASPRKISITRQLNRIYTPDQSPRARSRTVVSTTLPDAGVEERCCNSEEVEEENANEGQNFLGQHRTPLHRPKIGLASRMAARVDTVHTQHSQEEENECVMEKDGHGSKAKTFEVEHLNSQSSSNGDSQPLLGVLAPSTLHAGRTYGKERSYLTLLNEDARPAGSNGQCIPPSLDTEETPRKSYVEMRQQWRDFEDSGSEEEENGDVVSNITALRTAGEVRRFREEFEYLVNGFDSTHSVGTRVACALNLARHCIDDDAWDQNGEVSTIDLPKKSSDNADDSSLSRKPSFVEMLNLCGLIGELWHLLQQAGVGEALNTHLDSAGIVVLAQLAQNGASAEALVEAAEQDLAKMLVHLFASLSAESKKISDGRGRNSKAKAQRRTKRVDDELYAILKQAECPVFTDNDSHKMAQRLLLKCSCSLLQLLRVTIRARESNTLSSDDSRSILDSVTNTFLIIPEGGGDRVLHVDYESIALSAQLIDLVLTSAPNPSSLESIQNRLEYLGADSTVHWAELWTALLLTLHNEFSQRREEHAGMALVSLLRLFVNLTQRHRRWSELLAEKSGLLACISSLILATSTDQDDASRAIGELRSDTMAFSLGLLTNILEYNPVEARHLFRRLQLESLSDRDERKGGRSMKSVVNLLAQLFERERVRANESAQSGFLSGCLAVCLSLILDGTEEEEEPRRDEAGIDSARIALQEGLQCDWARARDTLAEVLGDFAATHEEMARCKESLQEQDASPDYCPTGGESLKSASPADISLVRLLKSRIEKMT